jgi:hypothetical protein
MASGHANRINRPNTWLHRPATRREDLTCQPGAVHTWHKADIRVQRREAAFDLKADIWGTAQTERQRFAAGLQYPAARTSGVSKIGGEGGIRTHGADKPHNGFRVLRFSCWFVPPSG